MLGWNRVANELGKVLVFLDSTSRSPLVGALSPVKKKDGNEVLGLKASLPSSGGAILSFEEVMRSQGPVMLRIPPVERRELDLPPVVRLAAPEKMRLAMDCAMLEKELLGKGLNL